MRKTRHVVLPVKSWQYIGLLIVSLACLTLGHVSRDREGRHGSLAGPELMHTAPNEVDICPNVSCEMYLVNTVTSASHSKPHIEYEGQVPFLESQDSSKKINSFDFTPTMSDEIREHRLENRRILYKLEERLSSDGSQERRYRSSKIRDIRVRTHNLDQAGMQILRIARENRARQDLHRRNSQFRTPSRESESYKLSTLRDNRHDMRIFRNRAQREFRMEHRSLSNKYRSRSVEDPISAKRQRDFLTERRLSATLEKREIANRININHTKHNAVRDAHRIGTDKKLLDSRMNKKMSVSEQRIRESNNDRVQIYAKERQKHNLPSETQLLNKHLSINRVRTSKNRQIPIQKSTEEINRERAAQDPIKSRIERSSLSTERVRILKNRQTSFAEREHRVRRLQNEWRLVTKERRIWAAVNRLDSQREKLLNAQLARIVENHQSKAAEGKDRDSNLRNERRSIDLERRLRSSKDRPDLREKRSLSSIRRVRSIENRESSDEESRIRNLQTERRSVSLERQIRVAENQYDSRTQQRTPSTVRIHMIRNRQIEIPDKKFNIRNLQNERRISDVYRQVQEIENRLDSRAQKKMPNIERVHTIRKQQIRMLDVGSRIRNLQNERKSDNIERRMRTDKNRLDFRAQQMIPNERIRMIGNGQSRISDKEARIRNLPNEKRLFDIEQRVRIAKNRFNSPVYRRASSTERVRVLKNRRIEVATLEDRIRNSQNARRLIREEQRMQTEKSILEYPTERKSSTVEQVHITENQGYRTSQAGRMIRDLLMDHKLSTANREGRGVPFKIENRARRTHLSHKTLQSALRQKLVSIRQENLHARKFSRIDQNIERLKAQKNRQFAAYNGISSTTQHIDNRKFLTPRNDNDLLSHRVASIFNEQLKHNSMHGNHRIAKQRSVPQASGNQLGVVRRKSQVQIHIEPTSQNNNQIKDIRIKMVSPQYLKSVISENNPNYIYTILQQAIIIIFCAAYGASILNEKTEPFRNMAQLTGNLIVW